MQDKRWTRRARGTTAGPGIEKEDGTSISEADWIEDRFRESHSFHSFGWRGDNKVKR